MSIHIDRLERKGCAARTTDPADGRQVLVRLTTAGLRVKEANSVLDPALVEALLSEITPSERRAAIEGLRILAGAADRLMSVRGAKEMQPA